MRNVSQASPVARWSRAILRVLALPSCLWGVAVFALVGCVPYQTYETLKNDKIRLQSAHDDLVTRYNRALQDILRLQKDGPTSQLLQEKVANLEQLNSELRAKLQQLATSGASFDKGDVERIGEGAQLEEGMISLSDELLFDAGVATLKNAQSRQLLDRVAELLQSKYPSDIVHLIGHTDSDPLSRTKSRWGTNHMLAHERAYTVFRYFTERGIPETRMMTHSAAYLKPIDPSNTKEAKAKNRRVNIALGGTKF